MILLLVIAIVLLLLFIYFIIKRQQVSLHGVHCMITGGSSGIGLSLAASIIKHGGSVSLIARSKERLESAKELLKVHIKSNDQKIMTFSVDISKPGDILSDVVKEAEKECGPINILVNCAGTSVCSSFLETPTENFSKMLEVNYLGSVNMTREVLPLMQNRKNGNIVFVSSMAGLMGLYGYTAYSASKFALLGLAESLQMEVKPYNIHITVAFPPDTDTPGFAEEIKNKPVETMRISESAGLFSAEQVASAILRDSLNKKFMSTVGFDGFVLATLSSSMTPINSFFELALQVMTMGIFRLAAVFILFQCDRTIQRCKTEKENIEKKKVKIK